MHEAEYSRSPTKTALYELRIRDDRYEILSDGNLCYSSEDLSKTIFNLQWLIHKEALKDVTESIRIHAGCGEFNGNRFLVVGDKGAGKTTLMVRLLFEGFRSVGDELILVRDGKAMPFPRRFHIKQESIKLLPEVENLFDSLPYNHTDYGHKMFSFTPHDAGFDWKIDEAYIKAIFYLKPNHGNPTSVEECPKSSMVQKVMPMTFLSESDDHMKIGELCRIIDSVDCFVVNIGDLDSAVSKLKQTMQSIY